jgi:Mg2+/Co2+ transporter CorC
LDTDSSLPPLLFLAASLLLFGWTSVVFAARSTPPHMMLVGAPDQPRLVRIVRVAAAALTGASAIVLAVTLGLNSPSAPDAAGWPLAGLMAAVAAAAAFILIALDYAGRALVIAFPGLARRLARPGRWLVDAVPLHNGDSHGNGHNGNSADATNDHPEAGTSPAVPLTPDELLNLDQYDIDMVRSISRMDDRDALHIMVPRLDIDAVEVSSPLSAVVDTLASSKHTRLPVYRGTMDDVVGIVHISDVLVTLANGDTDASLDSIMREPEFVAENMALDDLLLLMRNKSLQMGIVVDEYGGVEGIVTLEDVLEEIVGEIEDEFTDANDDDPARADDGSWLVNATLPIEDVAEVVGVPLDYGDVNTIGGYVYSQLGRMPAVGDLVQSGVVTIEVTQVRGRRIQELRIRLNDSISSPVR